MTGDPYFDAMEEFHDALEARLDGLDRRDAELLRRLEAIEKAMPRERMKGVYRGVWEAGRGYQAGDFVTRSGSLWHANEDTMEKPGDGRTSWRLAVKRGHAGVLEGKGGTDGA